MTEKKFLKVRTKFNKQIDENMNDITRKFTENFPILNNNDCTMQGLNRMMSEKLKMVINDTL